MMNSYERQSAEREMLRTLELRSFPKDFKASPKNLPPSETGSRGEYTPYRQTDAGSGFGAPQLKRTLRRPFIVSMQETIQRLDNWKGVDGRPVHRRKWYHSVGCGIFDGICINQENFDEIDCAQCIRSTFESFIMGCQHREFYVDQYGTRRCAACKAELGQDEDADVFEEDDFLEEDDPAEVCDPEIFLNRSDYGSYRKWNLERRFDQR